jgi:hypothetical protein
LCGLIVSVGGLTESIVRASSASLQEFLASSDGLPALSDFFDLRMIESMVNAIAMDLLKILECNAKVDRVTVPLFKTLDFLFTNGDLDAQLENESFVESLAPTARYQLTVIFIAVAVVISS